MTVCEKNRRIVQNGLDRRAAKRAEAAREAMQETASRDMRDAINFHSHFREIEKTVSERNERREKQDAQRRKIQREQEARRAKQWRVFLAGNLFPVLIAAALYGLQIIGGVEFWVALPIMAVCLVLCIANGAAYITRNRKAGNRKENHE